MTNTAPTVGLAFFARSTERVAIDLLGSTLFHFSSDGRTAGRIVETEAYLDATDLASHAAWSKRGQAIMYGSPGRIYIYRAYGIHQMFNIVTELDGTAGAVLIRALDPVEGIDLMRSRRRVDDVVDLCSGPGKLCQAMGFDGHMHGVGLAASDKVWMSHGPAPAEILVSRRIGITRSADLRLRYFDGASPFVSAHRRGEPLLSGGDHRGDGPG